MAISPRVRLIPTPCLKILAFYFIGKNDKITKCSGAFIYLEKPHGNTGNYPGMNILKGLQEVLEYLNLLTG